MIQSYIKHSILYLDQHVMKNFHIYEQVDSTSDDDKHAMVKISDVYEQLNNTSTKD